MGRGLQKLYVFAKMKKCPFFANYEECLCTWISVNSYPWSDFHHRLTGAPLRLAALKQISKILCMIKNK